MSLYCFPCVFRRNIFDVFLKAMGQVLCANMDENILPVLAIDQSKVSYPCFDNKPSEEHRRHILDEHVAWLRSVFCAKTCQNTF